MIRRLLVQRRGFDKIESRVFCSCELCRLRFGRLLYPKRSGRPLGLGQRRTRRIEIKSANSADNVRLPSGTVTS